ncbi:DNA topoisomerase 3 (plasmid) [Oscillospiraceae bacterium PP1C4]
MKLMIAEKPSVAQELAAIVGARQKEDGYISGNGYYVTWCVGHLISNAEPDQYDPELKQWQLNKLPIVPEPWQTQILERTRRQYGVIKKLFDSKEVDEIICAGDCGREGELIFRLVYNHAGCRKPVKRLWVSSLEEKELRRGLAELRDGKDFDNLYQAALCRSRADWLVGMNLSRLYSIMYSHKLTVGRVQTPTLALIVKRHKEIELFTPRPYWQIVADLGTWKATATADKADAAQAIVNRCNHKHAFVSKVQREAKKSSPPKLFNITSLQREANRLLGYTAQQTLTYLQSLYEKKLTTYPRTECEYLPSNMLDGLPERLAFTLQLTCVSDATKSTYDVSAADFGRFINDSKITDHHAIIPTGVLQDDNIPEPEKNILRLVTYRFLAALAPAHEYEHTTVLLDIEGEAFKATGKIITASGYQAVLDDMRRTLKGLDEDAPAEIEGETEGIPADLQEGQTLEDDIAVFCVEKATQPPRPYTDATLLAAMANAGSVIGDDQLKEAIKGLGLGTGATRAATIEAIIKGGYVARKGKQLLPTPDGIKLIEVVNTQVTQPEMTAEWEFKLEQIAAGELPPDQFMQDITKYVVMLVDAAKAYGEKDTETFKQKREVIGKCPRCGMNIVEYPKTFSCESGKDGCGFTIWKEDKFFIEKKKKIDKKTAIALLKAGKIKVKGLYSAKKDSTYDATVILVDTGKYVNFALEFDNAKK